MELHTSSYEASYEQKERAALIQKLKEFHQRFGYMPVLMFGDESGQAAPADKRPEPVAAKIMPLKQAAAYLNMSPRKLRDYAAAKKIAHSRPDSRTYLFRMQDLEGVRYFKQ